MLRRLHLSTAVLLVALGSAACSPAASSSTPAVPTAPSVEPPSRADGSIVPASADAPTPSPDATSVSVPAPSTGLAFGADAILDYYRNTGLTCGAPEPSTDADGWIVRECSGVDANGRRLLVGLVTDAHGALGDGYASVTGKANETVIGPEQALDQLSGFLGAMLGSERASPLLPWLAGSMGDPFEETKAAGVTIATYRRPTDDLRTIWLEVAGPGYPVRPAP